MRSDLASLVEEFRRHAAETAVVDHRGNRRYATSYGELAELAGRFAAELERRGVAAGERVVVWGENSAEWIGVFFGCLLRGVIAVPLDAAGSSEFANRVVKDVSPKMVVGDRGLVELVAGDVPRLVFSELRAVLPAEALFAVSAAVKGDAAFQIIFTSGTTAEPKGIVFTHRNVLASLQPIEDEIQKYLKYERWVHPLRFLHSVPLSHAFGQFMGLWTPVLLAAEVHFSEHLEPSRMVELMRRERASVLIAVPRVLQLLRVHLLGRYGSLAGEIDRAKGFSVWKRWWIFRRVHRALGWKFWAVISGGATLPSDLEDFWGRLGFALIQGYGMTETTALVTLNHPFHIGRGTIGKALPGREVRISEEGEILVRGEMLAGATWQGGTMRPRTEEWLATGDLAAKEESGELRFLGRKGDVIVTGAGMNVHPADLETAMMKQAGVRGCAVVPCEMKGGPEPVAVVLFAESDAELDAAVGAANRGLAEYQQIRRVLRWPEVEFPYTSTGKLLRRSVAEWACLTLAGRGGDVSGDGLLRMIAEITGEGVASGDEARLSEDLHLDSLGRVQLQSALEQRWGVELGDDEVAGVGTVRELRALVEGGAGRFPAASVGSGEVLRGSEDVYPRWPWWWPVRLLRGVFLEVVMRSVVWLLAGPRVVRRGELPAGPVLVIANHVTAYDGALVMYALPGRLRRRMASAMSGEMLMDLRRGRNQGNVLVDLLAPVGYWLVTALFNVFPLPRLRGFQRSFAFAGEAMDRGYSVLIFPEGTRSRDGEFHSFRAGIGLLALQSGVPVVPVALVGLGEMRKAGWFRSGRLEVRVGEAIAVAEGEDPAELTARLEASLRGLLGISDQPGV